MAVTAEFVRKIEGWRGDAALYKLSNPVEYTITWDDNGEVVGHAGYVIVSAVDCYEIFGRICETYIFASSDQGEVLGWAELPGSYRNGTDHQKALKGLLYYIDHDDYMPYEEED